MSVYIGNTRTLCFPGVKIQDIQVKIPTIQKQLPEADSLVIHVGSNYIKQGSSECLEQDFMDLIGAAKYAGKRLLTVSRVHFPQ